MASILISDLEPGARLAYDLRDGAGHLLLAARRPLSEAVLLALDKRGVAELIIREAEELPESTDASPRRAWLMTVATSPVDASTDAQPHADETVAPDQSLPMPFAALPAPSARFAELEQRQSAAMVRAALRRATDGIIAARTPRWNRISRRIERNSTALPIPTANRNGSVGGSRPQSAWRRERIGVVELLFARLASAQPVGMGALVPLIDEMIVDAGTDALEFIRAVVEGAAESDDLAAHAYSVAGVCVATAQRLGWSESDIRSAGLSGLLADCGQTLLQWDVRSAPRPLTDVETNAMQRHPAWSAALLELVQDDGDQMLDEAVQLAVLQHHERDDGTGYPARIRADALHDLARMVSVADVFVGLLSPRAHRPGMPVEAALAEVVRGASAGTLSRPIAGGLVLALGLQGSERSTPAVVMPARGARIAA